MYLGHLNVRVCLLCQFSPSSGQYPLE